MDTTATIRCRFEALSPHPDEKSFRPIVASETLPLGRGGVILVLTAAGVARPTICRGLVDLGEEPGPLDRVRRRGGVASLRSRFRTDSKRRLIRLSSRMFAEVPSAHCSGFRRAITISRMRFLFRVLSSVENVELNILNTT